MRRLSGTTEIPLREITCGGQPAMFFPRNITRPRLGTTSDMMLLMVVVLPWPLRPSSATASPSSHASEMP